MDFHNLGYTHFTVQLGCLIKKERKMKVLNLYASKTGNTQKVAKTIEAAAKALNHDVITIEAESDSMVDLLEYDMVFAGSGVYACMPPKEMNEFISSMGKIGMKSGNIQAGSPRRPSKHAVIYCTYGGTHTGVNEAVPCVKNIGQLFDHFGFEIIDEWYIVGAYIPPNMQEFNTNGRLGDISGRPNEADLKEVFEKAKGILNSV